MKNQKKEHPDESRKEKGEAGKTNPENKKTNPGLGKSSEEKQERKKNPAETEYKNPSGETGKAGEQEAEWPSPDRTGTDTDADMTESNENDGRIRNKPL